MLADATGQHIAIMSFLISSTRAAPKDFLKGHSASGFFIHSMW
jgi:hypothetical protein